MKYTADFERLWAKYPRKEGKQYAFKHFKRILKNDVSYNELLNAVENYAKECEKEERDRKYIKKGVNFFRHGTYEDYILSDLEGVEELIDISQATDYYIELQLNFDNKDIIKTELEDYFNNNKFTYHAYKFLENKIEGRDNE